MIQQRAGFGKMVCEWQRADVAPANHNLTYLVTSTTHILMMDERASYTCGAES